MMNDSSQSVEKPVEELIAEAMTEPLETNELMTQGRSLTEAGKSSEACQVFRKMLEYYPKSSSVYHLLAQCLIDAGLYSEALETLQTAIETVEVPLAEFHQLRGEIYFRIPQYQSAAEEFEAALGIDPDNLSAHLRLSDLSLIPQVVMSRPMNFNAPFKDYRFAFYHEGLKECRVRIFDNLFEAEEVVILITKDSLSEKSDISGSYEFIANKLMRQLGIPSVANFTFLVQDTADTTRLLSLSLLEFTNVKDERVIETGYIASHFTHEDFEQMTGFRLRWTPEPDLCLL